MNKKRRTRRERIDSIEAVRDFTRLESAFQYLKGAQVYMSVSTQIGLVTLAYFLLGTLVKFGFAKYFKLEFFIFASNVTIKYRKVASINTLLKNWIFGCAYTYYT